MLYVDGMDGYHIGHMSSKSIIGANNIEIQV